jgi:hypothetical protein
MRIKFIHSFIQLTICASKKKKEALEFCKGKFTNVVGHFLKKIEALPIHYKV